MFDIHGRSSRSEFWTFMLVNLLVLSLNYFAVLILTSSVVLSLKIAGAVIGIFLVYPSVSVSIRRLHDVGMKGRALLAVFIPVLGWLYLLIVLLRGSEPGYNEYGEYPKFVRHFN